METMIVDTWNQYLEWFPNIEKDIYFCEQYIKLYEGKNKRAFCIICYELDKALMIPFLRSRIGAYYDFETVYGYGGPIKNTNDCEWLESAWSEIKKKFKKEKYICGFMRFHPLLDNCKYYTSNSTFDRNTVYINTSIDEEQIWNKEISSKNRNMIRKAEKNGLKYEVDYDFIYLEEFKKLYFETMVRLNADDFYFFPPAYFTQFVDKLKGKSFLGVVKKDNEVICAALFMYSNCYGHYHLEGSNHDFSSLGANNLLLWKTACEFHRLGVDKFHLGGGYNSSLDNSLYKFKKAFSSNVSEFHIGKYIFNDKLYKTICQKWKDDNPEKISKYGNRLLMYRY